MPSDAKIDVCGKANALLCCGPTISGIMISPGMAGAIGTLGETEFVAIWQFSRRMLAGDRINLPGLSMPPWRKFALLSSPDGVPVLISWKGVAGLATMSIILFFFSNRQYP